MPVWIVVTLLGTLVATPLPIVVLSSEPSLVAVKSAVGCEQAHVPDSGPAVLVVVVVFVHAVLQVIVAIVVVTLGGVFRNGAKRNKMKCHKLIN